MTPGVGVGSGASGAGQVRKLNIATSTYYLIQVQRQELIVGGAFAGA